MVEHRNTPLASARSDVLIVGAGAIGLVLAIALARGGRNVMLIEGGPRRPPRDFVARNAGPLAGLPHLGLTIGRMKAFGGTTRLWGGQLAAFGPADFHPTYAGKPAWPIGYELLAPYFTRAFDFVGVPAAARDPVAVWRRVGGMPPELGEALVPSMNIWLPIADFTKLFKEELAGLPNLHVVTDLSAEAIMFDRAGRVEAIIGRSRIGPDQRLVADEFVLANGTMEIARLLLGAAANAAHCPFADNPNIGRGFIDHLHGIVGRIDTPDLARLRVSFENIHVDGRKYSIKIRASDRFVEKHGIANCAATLNASGSIRQTLGGVGHLVRRLFARSEWRNVGAALVEGGRTLAMLAPILWTFAVHRRAYSLFHRGILVGLEVEQLPNAESRLFLDPSAPPGHSRIGLDWRLDGREIEAVRQFCLELTRSFAERGLGKIVLDDRILAADPAALASFHDAFHHMGGARMAESATQGVVDRDLRVFGCANLSVAGAAVFPTGSFANPTLTAMALAHRLADRLLGLCPVAC